MYAPIYLPQVKPASPEVAAVERAIIEAEGAYHVGGRYFANQGDARQERRRLAERRVREARHTDPYDECWTGSCDGTARFRLATWITPRERQQVDAAVLDCVRTLHRDALPAVGRDLARTDADGALISAARIGRDTVPLLASLVRGFPAHSIIGLVGEVAESEAISGSLFFGQAGVRYIADVRTARGWQEFRRLCDCARQPDAFMREAVATVLREIASGETALCSDGLAEFFRHVFSPRLTSAKELAGQLGLHASTLMSRFFRAGLPSPKRYVAHARLIWAAHLAESPAMSISAIATRLNASSPQSFHRTVRTLMGMSAAEFRRSFDGARALESFRSRLVTPYLDALSRFDPLADSQVGPQARARSTVAKGQPTAGQGRAA